ncbi:MAG: type II secretion system protein [Opitutales bacterium]
MKLPRSLPSLRGFTLVEVMVAMTIVGLVFAGAMSTYLLGLQGMYKDEQRLVTNATLRYFVDQVSIKALSATDFYVFPNYQSLNGNVDLVNGVSPLVADSYGTYLAYGDCLVLVTLVSDVSSNSYVRQFCIYYRQTASTGATAPIRFYQSQDYGTSGTSTTLTALLNAVNLNATPAIAGSQVVVANSRGRLKNGSTTTYYPIFATESATATPTDDSVSINVEVINGTTVNNLLSSSSFNYTISPRK